MSKRLRIPTLAILGAATPGCGIGSIVGDWEVTRWGAYGVPTTDNYDGITYTKSSIFSFEKDGDLEVEMLDSGVKDGEEVYNYAYTYDGDWAKDGRRKFKIDVDGFDLKADCVLESKNVLECEDRDDEKVELERMD